MVRRRYPKPKPVGRPRLCKEIIKEVRRLHSEEKKSYNWIAWFLGISPTTIQRYCNGKWKDYDPEKALNSNQGKGV